MSQKIGVIQAFVKNLKKRHFKEYQLSSLFSLWDDIVGETISSHSSVSSYHNGILYITVTDSMWLNELRMEKHAILKKISAHSDMPKVEDIIFKFNKNIRKNDKLLVVEFAEKIDLDKVEINDVDETALQCVTNQELKIKLASLQKTWLKIKKVKKENPNAFENKYNERELAPDYYSISSFGCRELGVRSDFLKLEDGIQDFHL